MTMKAAIVIERIGPYHLARLKALGERLEGRLLVVEVCAMDDTYQWARVHAGGPFERATLFANERQARRGKLLWRTMAALLDRAQPTVVAVPGWGAASSLTALAWSSSRRRAAILMSDSNFHDEVRRPWMECVKKLAVRAASAGFVAGKPQRRYLELLGMPAERISCGYDVVDNAYFRAGADAVRARASEARSALQLPAEFALWVGRFVEKKNLERLIEGYARYSARRGDTGLHLVLVGDGPLRSALEDRIARHRLEAVVHMKPFAQYPELPQYFGLARALVLPSVVEQWGLVVNEAMASGTPAFVSNRCGCVEDLVIEGVTGRSFDPWNTEAIAAVFEAASDRSAMARMGRHAAAHIQSWPVESFADGFLEAAAFASRQSRPAGKSGFASAATLRVVAALR
jgi:glycosyltransferase involved in cell wall biosynthesis